MTKKEMAKEIAEKIGITVALATKIVQTVFDQIVQTLETAGRIELPNFGIFEVRKRRPRAARNPRTGEQVVVSEKLAMAFRPGKNMEEWIRQTAEVAGQV